LRNGIRLQAGLQLRGVKVVEVTGEISEEFHIVKSVLASHTGIFEKTSLVKGHLRK
jgi:hypothetical protein